MLGKWFISKYKLRKDFLSCESPLLREPPADIIDKDYQVAPDGSHLTFKMKTGPKRHAFMLCQLIPALNRASEYYKQQHCANDKSTNYDYTYIFHDRIEEDDWIVTTKLDGGPRRSFELIGRNTHCSDVVKADLYYRYHEEIVLHTKAVFLPVDVRRFLLTVVALLSFANSLESPMI